MNSERSSHARFLGVFGIFTILRQFEPGGQANKRAGRCRAGRGVVNAGESDRVMREISIDHPEPDAEASPAAAAEGSDDASLCVEASSAILVLDRAVFGPEAEARARRRRRWKSIGLWCGVAVVSLLPGLFALLSHTGSQVYERRRLAAACESPETERLKRVLACIDLCGRGSGPHCAKKGDIYTASQDIYSAARAYREACQLGEVRACRMASPAR